MAVNVKGGQPNVVVAKVSASFFSIGLDASKVSNIFLVDYALKSFNPNRTLNPITMFEQGKGYYINALQDMDLELYVGPPFPVNANAITTEEDFEIIPES